MLRSCLTTLTVVMALGLAGCGDEKPSVVPKTPEPVEETKQTKEAQNDARLEARILVYEIFIMVHAGEIANMADFLHPREQMLAESRKVVESGRLQPPIIQSMSKALAALREAEGLLQEQSEKLDLRDDAIRRLVDGDGSGKPSEEVPQPDTPSPTPAKNLQDTERLEAYYALITAHAKEIASKARHLHKRERTLAESRVLVESGRLQPPIVQSMSKTLATFKKVDGLLRERSERLKSRVDETE